MSKKSAPGKKSVSKPEKTEIKSEPWTRNKTMALIPFVIAVIIFMFMWFDHDVVVMDPWIKAAQMIDSSSRVQDPKLKTELLEEGGKRLKELVIKHPYHAGVHFLVGYYYLRTGQWDSTIAHQKEAFRIDSGSTINPVWTDALRFMFHAYTNKCTELLKQNKPREAVNILNEALQYQQNNPQIRKLLGNIYLNLNDIDKAVENYNICLSVNPNDADIYNNFGVIASQKGQNAQAAEMFKKALSINPNHPNAKKNYQATMAAGIKK